MRIGMILPTKFPPDIRVEKELGTLMTEHEVFLLCPKRSDSPAREVWKGMKIFRVFSDAQRWWNNWRLMATCYSSSWEREIDHYIQENGLEVLHVHDLPLLGTALKSAGKHGVPVVADLHENYPAMLRESLKVPIYNCSSLGALVLRLTVSVDRWFAYERSAVPQADAVITVIEEARERLMRNAVPAYKIHVVANYNSQAEASDESVNKKRSVHEPGKLRVVYAGGFDKETRDLRTVIDAVALLERAEFRDLEVVMVGGVGRELAKLKQYAAQNGVMDRVSIHEWLPLEEAERIMDSAQVGLVPHVKSAHTDSTIPHKLFQYMSRRLPVIVSNCTPLERIVLSSHCGLVYRSGDSQSLADCMKKIYQSPVDVKHMGDAGHSAVQKKYNWVQAGENLLRIYSQFAQRTRTAHVN